MQELDLLFRISGAVILLMTSLLILRDVGQRKQGVLLFLFVLGVVAYLVGNAADRGFIVPHQLEPFRQILSGNVAFVYWWFSRSLFEDDFALGPLEWSVAAVWVSLFVLNVSWAGAPINLSWVSTGIGLSLVIHVSWLLVTERGDDLVPERRNVRLLFAAIPSVLFGLDLFIDIMFGFAWKPLWFTVWQNAVLLIVCVSLALWLLRVDAAMFARLPKPKESAPSGRTSEDPKLRDRLLRLMEEEKPYLDPALNFAAFAKQLGIGQVTLRTMINKELGYRHFRNFLNEWRIEAAKRMLADPARVDDKIVSIAFEAGFASLASFNRVFLVQQNQPPSAYRAEVLRDQTVDSG